MVKSLIKKKSNKNSSQVSEIKSLCNIITEDNTKVIEQLPKTVLAFLSILEKTKIDKNFSEKELQNVLDCYFFIENVLSIFINNKKQEFEDKLIEFVISKAKVLNKVFIDLIEINDKEFSDWNTLLVELLKMNSILVKNDQDVYVLIEKSILFNEIISTDFFESIVNSFIVSDFNFALSLKLNTFYEKFRNKLENESLTNLVNFTFDFPSRENLDKLILNVEEKNNFLISFQNYLVKFLDDYLNDFDNETLKVILKKLDSHLFNLCYQPQSFSDFILRLYRQENRDKDMKVLTLSCLFTLVIKHDYIFEEYYETLYTALFIKDIVETTYFNRLIKILYYSLKPASVSKIVICSFIKKLSRVALKTNTSQCCKIIELIEHLFHYHKKCLTLLHKNQKTNSVLIFFKHETANTEIWNNSKPQLPSNLYLPTINKEEISGLNQVKYENLENDNMSANDDNDSTIKSSKNIDSLLDKTKVEKEICASLPKYDKFNEDEHNPYNTLAGNSCLWELYSLKIHYNLSVRKRVNKMTRKFVKKDLELDKLLEINESNCDLALTEKSNFFYNYNTTKEVVTKIINNLI